MKERFLKIAMRIDAMTLRERVMLFAGVAASIMFILYMMALDPLYARERALRNQIAQQNNNLTGIDAEISAKLAAYQKDPDADNRKRLADIKAETAKLGESLRSMQKGLVPPEKVVPLLESILAANGRLKLVSMKTLPVSGLSEQAAAAPKAKEELSGSELAKAMVAQAQAKAQPAAEAPKETVVPKVPELLYRHGVEITLQGSYLDMIAYMNALESMPTQLFWGKAALDAQEYPKARLTLTLYTLSLDKKWMKL